MRISSCSHHPVLFARISNAHTVVFAPPVLFARISNAHTVVFAPPCVVCSHKHNAHAVVFAPG